MKEYETGGETWETVQDDNINEDVKKSAWLGVNCNVWTE